MTDEHSDKASDGEMPEIDRLLAVGKTILVLAGIFLCVFMIVSPVVNSYNSLVDSDLQASRASANIKVDLERRADLLPNLASGVKGSAIFEHNTVVETAMARGLAQMGTIREHVKAGSGTPIEQIQGDDSVLTAMLGNFVKLQEQYPTLQTTQQFREFEAQVTATENEILRDRHTYNAAAMQYQATCRSFPTVLLANVFGFDEDKWPMWESPNSARTQYAPNITFDDLASV